MKHILFIVIFILSSVGASAKSNKHRLHSRNTEVGSMYFVGSKKLTKVSKGIKRFEFDITYVTDGDTATVNFTIISDNPSDVSSLSFCNANVTVPATDVELLFHEVKGKKYVVRTTSKISYKDLKSLYTSSSPLIFKVTRDNQESNTFSYSSSQWKKETDFFQRVFYLINK